MNHINDLVAQLWDAQEAEAEAKKHRTELEAQLAAAVGMPDDWTGTKTTRADKYKVVTTRRMNVRIDGKDLQARAHAAGLTDRLTDFFRFKPDLIAAAWKSAPAEVLEALSPAITMTPGKASFSVSIQEEE